MFMQKVWMVWQEVDFGQDWIVGVFATQAKADAAKADFFAEWLDNRAWTEAEFKKTQMDNPFTVTTADVQ